MGIDAAIPAGDVSIAVRDWGGSGPPLLLIPGGGCNLEDFTLMVPSLLDSFHVYGMDCRNHGLSSDGPWNWDLALDDVRAVIAHFGLDRPVIAGHSLGGMLAAMLATTDECRAAINIDGHGSGTPDLYDGIDEKDVLAFFASTDQRLAEAREKWAPVATPETYPVLKPAAIGQLVGLGFTEEQAEARLSRAMRVDDDGNVWQRTGIEASIEIASLTRGADFFAIYRATKVALLVYNATKEQQVPGMSEGDLSRLASFRRGLSIALERLSSENELVGYHIVDATHSLIYEIPAVLSAQITDFARGL